MLNASTVNYKCSWVHLELTSKCNLRCVYCAVSQPSYKGEDLDLDISTSISEWIVRNKVPNVNLNGHGETTILQGWTKIAKPLLSSSARCHLITNASKIFSEEELETLSKMESITISCDTFDSGLYARLRRKSQLRNVLRNISEIRLAARKNKISPPGITLSCVLGAENSHSLEEFLNFSACMNIHTVQLCSLTDYPLPPDSEIKLNPLSTLPNAQLITLKDLLSGYLAKPYESLGMNFAAHPGILEEINDALSSSSTVRNFS